MQPIETLFLKLRRNLQLCISLTPRPFAVQNYIKIQPIRKNPAEKGRKMTLRGPLEVKRKVAGELFLQIRTRLVVSFETIPHLTIFEHIQYLTFRGPWGSN